MLLAGVCLVALSSLLPAQAQDVATYDFLSRPDIKTPRLNVNYIDPHTVGDGYIFMTPSSGDPANFTFGMRIYNNNGSLVWDGTSFNVPHHQVTDLQACNFKGQPHLCVTMFQGEIGGGVAKDSYDLILDNTYKQVLTTGPDYSYKGYPLTPDLHEFNVLGGEGESALISSYALTRVNVTFPHCPGSPSISWVKNGLFTETALDGTNSTIFAWSAIDHVPATDCYLCPCGGPKVGCGKEESDAFDYFHINAIDKDADGDYLVSGRHVWTLFKIAGLNSPSKLAPGTIIWRLGGKQSTFDMKTVVPNSGTFNFSWQHHARFQDGGVRFWDNANDAVTPPSALSSSGMDVKVDEESMTATLVNQFIAPSRALDGSQGSHQILPNGNHFCGLGSVAEIFERTESGALVFDAHFGIRPVESYRAFRYPWIGHPAVSQLAMFSYAPACGARNAFHISWNGATEVASYRFFAGNSTTGPFVQAGSVHSDAHFENVATADRFGHYGYGEALDAAGNVLGRTPTVKTFVPAPGAFAQSCNAVQCAANTDYTTAPQAQCS